MDMEAYACSTGQFRGVIKEGQEIVKSNKVGAIFVLEREVCAIYAPVSGKVVWRRAEKGIVKAGKAVCRIRSSEIA
jgi:hypothetical protein